MQISLKRQSVLGWFTKKTIINIIIMIKKSYSLYNVVSVREEFWVSPWFVSHAKNVTRGAYDGGGHFHINICIYIIFGEDTGEKMLLHLLLEVVYKIIGSWIDAKQRNSGPLGI